MKQTESGSLISDTLVLIAWVENPSAGLIPDSLLEEKRLDARYVIIDLAEEKFRDFASLDAGDFTLVDVPGGTSIQSVTGISQTQVEIQLQVYWGGF